MLSLKAVIPQLMQCFQYLGLGYTVLRCVRVKTCLYGKSAPGDYPCDDLIKCINCGGQHSFRSHNHPVYKQ